MITLDELWLIIEPLSKCWKIFSKKTANEFIPKLYGVIIKRLQCSKDNGMDELIKTEMNRILVSVGMLLRRVGTKEEIDKMIDANGLKLAI